jgi:translation initiation factor 1
MEPARVPPEKQTARMQVERRARGKQVTVVRGLVDEGDHLGALLSRLKGVCGAGGTVREGVIEIQGDHLTRLRETLTSLGYRVR